MNIVFDAVGIRGHGAANVLEQLLKEFLLTRPDWEWYLFLLDKRYREFELNISSPNLILECTQKGNNGFERILWVNKYLKDRVKRIKPDLIFSFANMGAIYPEEPQIVFVHQPNIFNIISFNGSIIKKLRFFMLKKVILCGAKNSKFVVVQSSVMANGFKKNNKDLGEKIKVIPSGYRIKNKQPAIKEEIKQEILSSGKPRIVYISHPSEHKNHNNLIRAVKQISSRFPGVTLLLTLEKNIPPNKRYRRFVTEMGDLIKELNIETNIKFLGILNPDEVYYALQESDIMAFPSFSESFGLGLVEAMYSGCPIAASDLPYARDVTKGAAVFFDPYNVDSIADSIIKLLEKPELRIDLIKKGKIISEEYSYSNIAKQFIQLFETI